jgi:hypothetical protein
MKIEQLSVFLENRPGRIEAPCAILAQAGINILTLTLADTERFGILRLIVREWERAKRLLSEAGYVVKATPVAAVQVEDRPGGLCELLKIVEDAGVNIAYMYAFTIRAGGKATMILRLDDIDKGSTALRRRGLDLLSADALFELAEK